MLSQSAGGHKISAHTAVRTHHGPAYNELLHYVVLTVRTAGLQRKERPTRAPQTAAHPRQNESSKPEREGGQKPEAGEGSACSLPLGLSASGLEKISPWGFAAEQCYFSKINEPQIAGPAPQKAELGQ